MHAACRVFSKFEGRRGQAEGLETMDQQTPLLAGRQNVANKGEDAQRPPEDGNSDVCPATRHAASFCGLILNHSQRF
jgi:hypothetical protein